MEDAGIRPDASRLDLKSAYFERDQLELLHINPPNTQPDVTSSSPDSVILPE